MTNLLSIAVPSTEERLLQWNTSAGYVRLTYPGGMAADDIDDVEKILALVVRGMRRRIDPALISLTATAEEVK